MAAATPISARRSKAGHSDTRRATGSKSSSVSAVNGSTVMSWRRALVLHQRRQMGLRL